MTRALLVGWLAGCVALVPVPRSPGCAIAPPAGGWAATYAETAVLIWDADAGVEHFIRSAAFTGTSADFGFLVPTPGRPDLGDAPWQNTGRLEAATAPRTEVRRRLGEFGCGSPKKTGSVPPRAAAPAPAPVQVVERKRVGGFDAAVLKATDADALRGWLGRNGYASRPELRDWLGDYVDDGWHLTAFKVANDLAGGRAVGSLHPVRLSFPTPQPVYPYKEPADAAKPDTAGQLPPRLLRLFVLAPARMESVAGLGRGGPTAWQLRTVWAGPIDRGTFEAVGTANGLPADAVAKLAGRPWVLTEFEDTSSPRTGGTDLSFRPSADQSPVERPPHVTYEDMYWPYYAATGGLGVGGPLLVWLGWKLVRRLIRRLPAAPLD